MSAMRGGSLRIIALIAANDFKLTLKARGVVFWIFAMPVVFMLAFGLAFKDESGGVRKARLTIENADTGFVARALVDELRGEPLQVVDSLAAGDKAVRTLFIPPDFTEKVLARSKVALVLRKESDADVQASEAVNAAVFRSLMHVVSCLIEVEANALDSIEVEFDSLRAAPPLVTVSSTVAGKMRKIPSGFQSSVPGNLVMFVLMTMVFSGAVITVERFTGVLRRYAYTPAGRGSILLGKLFGRMLVALVQIVFLLIIGKYLFRISLGQSPGALILLMTVFAFSTGAFGVFFGSLFRNPEQVSAVSIVTTLAMAALGGCWWSIELVPRAFKAASFLFPTGWAMDGIHKIISFGYGMSAVAIDVAVLAGFGVVFVLLASWKLKLAD